MGSSRRDKKSARADFPDSHWQERQIERTAGRFRRLGAQELEDLKGELAVTLLEIQQNPPNGIRNWKAYLAKCLSNRASSFAKKRDLREARETTTSFDPETIVLPSPTQLPPSRAQQARRLLVRARRVLDPDDYEILTQLAPPGATQSSVAILRGVHRNTIGRAVRRIRQSLQRCPIENVTAPLTLLDYQRRELMEIAESRHAKARDQFRARLILSLSSGSSYAEVEAQLGTTRPTIARWKQRFESAGINGLKSRHRGRQPFMDARKRVTDWLRANRWAGKGVRQASCRYIAGVLGISKSTIHRILRKASQESA